jgi:hypothetical protein
MDWASVFYLGTTFGLLAVFIALAIRTYSRRNRQRLEEPKHRMLDDD